MYVVSTDGDLKEYCETSDCLIALDKIAGFINVIESHYDEDLVHSVNMLLNKNQDAIKKAIAEAFCEQDFWIEDQDGDVNEVRVNELEVSKILILDVDQDSAFVHIDVETNFSADLTYNDLDTTAYDSEKRVLIPWSTIDKTVDQDVTYTAAAEVLHDKKDPQYFVVDWVEIQPDQSSGFALHADFAIHIDNERPYKR